MAPPLLSLREVDLHWGSDPVLDKLEMHIGHNDRLCLIGRNGAGKSTLLKVIAGIIDSDGGERWLQPGATAAYLPQEPDASGHDTLRDYILAGLTNQSGEEDYKADVLIADLCVEGDADPLTASGGELRRAALARTLITEPDLLLLDEPTNHLDITIIDWLEGYLKNWRGAMVLISHDRTFLGNLATACLWLDRGKIRRFDGRFDKFDAWQEKTFAEEADALKKLNKVIKDETRWSVEGISARRTRNQGRLRRLHALRDERRNIVKAKGDVTISLGGGGKSGARVVETKNISKTYDGRSLFSDFSIRIARGDRIGIIGPNGAGKSTLIKILMGEIAPDEGTVQLGTNLQPIIIDQKRANLKDDMSVMDVLTGGDGDWIFVGDESRHVMTYLKEFLFDPSQARTPVSSLSGGERNRLLIAANFAKKSNLMVLDEPTNDLDMETLDLLQETLADYKGTILLVSHDRDFLDRVVTSTIVLEGDGTIMEYPGGYSDYRAQRANSAAADSAFDMGRQKKKSKVVSLSGAPKNKKKLSFKDQHALDTLPAEVESLSMQISELEAQISDPQLYSKDPSAFSRISDQLTEMRSSLEEKELRWLELEEMRESLET